MPIRDPNATPTAQADPRDPNAAPSAPVAAPPAPQIAQPQAQLTPTPPQGGGLQQAAAASGGFRSMDQIRQAAGTPTDLGQAISRNLFNIGFGYLAQATGNIGYVQMGQDIGNLLQNRWWRAEADQFASREGQAMMGGAQAAMQRWQAQVTPRSIQKPDGTVIEGVLRDLNDPNSAVSISTPEGHQVLAQANAGMADTIKNLTSNYIQAALKYRDNPYIRDTAHALLKSEYDWMGHITDAYDNARAASMQQQQFETSQQMSRATIAKTQAETAAEPIKAEAERQKGQAAIMEGQAALQRTRMDAKAPKTITDFLGRSNPAEWSEDIDKMMPNSTDEGMARLAANDGENIENLQQRAQTGDVNAIHQLHSYRTEARGQNFARMIWAARGSPNVDNFLKQYNINSQDDLENKLQHNKELQRLTGVYMEAPENKPDPIAALGVPVERMTDKNIKDIQIGIDSWVAKAKEIKDQIDAVQNAAEKDSLKHDLKKINDRIGFARDTINKAKQVQQANQAAVSAGTPQQIRPRGAPQRRSPSISQVLGGQLPQPAPEK